MIRGYVVEYSLKDSPNIKHYETVEDAVTPLQAVEAVEMAEGRGNIVQAKTYHIQ